MRKITCMHTQNDCYAKNVRLNSNIPHIGIVVHSTGANNTNLKRYVQPSTNDPNRAELLKLIGTNTSNSWNRSGVEKAVHYFIGKLADGSIATAQNLPENYFCWGSGKGSKGNYNYEPYAHIQFEMCEDNLTNADYFRAIMKEAQELCADICLRYNWNADVIVSHKEAHLKGYGSNHADINHWLAQFQKDMNWFRTQVQTLIDKARNPVEPEPEVKPYTPKVGDIVDFTGNIHYRSSNATTAYSCKPGLAEVTRTYKGTHPYHLKAISGSTSTVGGWVDTEFIKEYVPAAQPKPEPKPEPTPVPEVKPVVDELKVGDQVKLVQGATWSNGKKPASWVFRTTLYIRDIQQSGGKTVYVLSRYKTVKAYTGKVYREALEKA